MKKLEKVLVVLAIALWCYIFASCISSLHIKELDYESKNTELLSNE